MDSFAPQNSRIEKEKFMKTAIITGASRGIGRAIAKAFALAGYSVIATYKSDKSAADSLEKELSGYDITFYQLDVSNFDAVNSFSTNLLKTRSVDVLINNAGIARQKLFTDVTPDEYREMMATNADGVFFVTQAIAKNMLKNHRGSIINISSMWGQVGASCEVDYSMAKAAVIGFTKALAKELGPSGITVNCIAPGVVETDMVKGLGEETLKALADETPLMRNGKPEEIAKLALFLAEDNFITGQIIGQNGGLVI